MLFRSRVNNLEYGSYAPGAPQVFIDDSQFRDHWLSASRYYLCVEAPRVPAIEKLVGKPSMHVVRESGGKFVYVNHEN